MLNEVKKIQIDNKKFLFLSESVDEDGNPNMSISYHDTDFGNSFSVYLTPEQAFTFGKEIVLAATRMRLGKGIVINDSTERIEDGMGGRE